MSCRLRSSLSTTRIVFGIGGRLGTTRAIACLIVWSKVLDLSDVQESLLASGHRGPNEFTSFGHNFLPEYFLILSRIHNYTALNRASAFFLFFSPKSRCPADFLYLPDFFSNLAR